MFYLGLVAVDRDISKNNVSKSMQLSIVQVLIVVFLLAEEKLERC